MDDDDVDEFLCSNNNNPFKESVIDKINKNNSLHDDDDELNVVEMTSSLADMTNEMKRIMACNDKIPLFSAFYSLGEMYVYGNVTHLGYLSPLMEFLYKSLIKHSDEGLMHPDNSFCEILRRKVITNEKAQYTFLNNENLKCSNGLKDAIDILSKKMSSHSDCMWFLVYDDAQGIKAHGNAYVTKDLHNDCMLLPFLHFVCNNLVVRAGERQCLSKDKFLWEFDAYVLDAPILNAFARDWFDM